MSDHRWPAPHHNSVPEFQLSGIPHVTTFTLPGANNVYIKFPVSFDQVTRWIEIMNHNDNGNDHIFLFFNEEEANTFVAAANAAQNPVLITDTLNNGIPLNTSGSRHIRIDKTTYTPRFELKCKKIWIVGKGTTIVSVIAGVTNIPSNTFPDQTKLNGFTGVQS